MNTFSSFEDLRFRLEEVTGDTTSRLIAVGLVPRVTGRPVLGGVLIDTQCPGTILVVAIDWDGTLVDRGTSAGQSYVVSEDRTSVGLQRRALEACLFLQLRSAAAEWPCPSDSPVRQDIQRLYAALLTPTLWPLIETTLPEFYTWLTTQEAQHH